MENTELHLIVGLIVKNTEIQNISEMGFLRTL